LSGRRLHRAKAYVKFAVTRPDAKQSAAGFTAIATLALPLGWNDIVTLE
jgi:hypothetical protein